jgi:heterogeneous nuclear ribonucleoprotein R
MDHADFNEATPALIDPMTLPAHGCEVFVGSLNRAATEDQLREFASEAGEVFSVKMVMDPANTAQNRGYSFVTFAEKESALRAMDRLSGKPMKDFPEQLVRVQPSQTKNKLWIGGLPHSMNEEALKEALVQLDLKGLVNIDLAKSKETPDSNRGFGFLEFYNSTAAAQAKAKLSNPDVRVGDRTVNVDLAEPTPKDQAAIGGSKNVFVGNLTESSATEEKLKEAFAVYGEIEKVTIPRPKDGETFSKFAFVHFTERVAAMQAVQAESKPEVDGVVLMVKYGRADNASGQQQHGGSGGGGRGGGYHNNPYHQQQNYQQQYYGGGYGQQQYGGNLGMMGMMAVQLPNGQLGYMLQPGAMMGGGDGGGMMRGGRGGGWRGGRGGRGGGGGYRGGRGGGGGQRNDRYHPY